MHLARRSWSYLLGRDCDNWNKGNGNGKYEALEKTRLNAHSKMIMGRSNQLGI